MLTYAANKKKGGFMKGEKLLSGVLVACVILSFALFATSVTVFYYKGKAIDASANKAMAEINRLKIADPTDLEQLNAYMRQGTEYYRAYMDFYRDASNSNFTALIYGLISTGLVAVLTSFVQRQKTKINELNEGFKSKNEELLVLFEQRMGNSLQGFELSTEKKEFEMGRTMASLDDSVKKKLDDQKKLEASISTGLVQVEGLNASLAEVKAFDAVMQMTNQIMMHSAVLYGVISNNPKAERDFISASVVALRECFRNVHELAENTVHNWKDEMKALFKDNLMQAKRNLEMIRKYAVDPTCHYEQLTSDELLVYCEDCLALLA